MSKPPNPGSEEAIRLLCKCAVIDNHYGEGFSVSEDGERLFWITASCPIHGRAQREDEEDGKRE
jgi:hypothetical protein